MAGLRMRIAGRGWRQLRAYYVQSHSLGFVITSSIYTPAVRWAGEYWGAETQRATVDANPGRVPHL